MTMRRLMAVTAASVVLTGCGASDVVAPGGVAPAASSGEQVPVGTDVAFNSAGVSCDGTADADFPDVIAIEYSHGMDGWFVGAWVCSAYDSDARYADAWRVLDQDGNELAIRELDHPHATEQPFVRELAELLDVPTSVTHLTIEGRDSVNGWGGATSTVDIRATD